MSDTTKYYDDEGVRCRRDGPRPCKFVLAEDYEALERELDFELEERCARYRQALEEIAGNESDVNAERADGIAITALTGLHVEK